MTVVDVELQFSVVLVKDDVGCQRRGGDVAFGFRSAGFGVEVADKGGGIVETLLVDAECITDALVAMVGEVVEMVAYDGCGGVKNVLVLGIF